MSSTLRLEDLVPATVLDEIVADLVESLFGEAEARPIPVPFVEGVATVGARIHIAGGWNGSLVLRTTRALAEDLAARLFALSDLEASDADVLDVLGELVNIVGGNVKALLPGPNALSLPEPSLEDVAPVQGGICLGLRWGAEPLQLSMAPAGTPVDAALVGSGLS